MRRIFASLSLVGMMAIFTACATSQPPDGKDDKEKKGPPPFGKLFPREAEEALNLTDDQKTKIEELQKEVKAKLEKILTPEQMKTLESMRPKGPPMGEGKDGKDDEKKGDKGDKKGDKKGGKDGMKKGDKKGDKGDKGGEKGDKGDKKGGDEKGRQERPPTDTSANDGGVQWFATLERGLAEANRTGKPVLFLTAAPHCGGVSGIW